MTAPAVLTVIRNEFNLPTPVSPSFKRMGDLQRILYQDSHPGTASVTEAEDRQNQ